MSDGQSSPGAMFSLLFFLAVAWFFDGALRGRWKEKVRYHHRRGLRLSTSWRVASRLGRYHDRPGAFVWGRFRVPLALAGQHCLITGNPGSGKTIVLRLLMQSVFPRIGRGDGHRALVYDGKGELRNVVLGMRQPGQCVFSFDPFSEDGVGWHIAGDVVDDATANLVARLLFPKQDGEHQPFWPETVQNLASALMQVLNDLAPGRWLLIHLLYIMRSEQRIKATLALTERGRDTLSQFSHSGETWGNITATISNRINDYEIVAALWSNAKHAVSLKDWSEGESILLLRKHHLCGEVVDAANRVILALARRNLLSKPEDPARRTWMIWDEAASLGAGAAGEMTLLMEQGRSRNICCVLAFQTIASLRAAFGKERADALIGLASVKAFLRAEDAASSEWQAGFFGKREVTVESTSATGGSGGSGSSSSRTVSYQDKEVWVVEPSEFQAIPRAGAEHGVTGYFFIPDGNPPLAFKDTLPPGWLFGGRTLAPVADVPDEQRPAHLQRTAVTQADIDRLLGIGDGWDEDGGVGDDDDNEPVATPDGVPAAPAPPAYAPARNEAAAGSSAAAPAPAPETASASGSAATGPTPRREPGPRPKRRGLRATWLSQKRGRLPARPTAAPVPAPSGPTPPAPASPDRSDARRAPAAPPTGAPGQPRQPPTPPPLTPSSPLGPSPGDGSFDARAGGAVGAPRTDVPTASPGPGTGPSPGPPGGGGVPGPREGPGTAGRTKSIWDIGRAV